ncbi:putative type VI secretion system effector [Massilia phosphatilytica]
MKNQEPDNSTVLLRGAISGLKQSRRSHDFVLTEVQHQQIGITVIAASAMSMGATGIGLLGMASNADEEADWVEFDLNGKQVKGWLWMMPMRNGDTVAVVAEPMGNDQYIAYAIKRDSDDLLAVYPHATSGRMVHYRKSVKAWMWCSILAYLIVILMFLMQNGLEMFLEADMQLFLPIGFASCSAISAVIAFRVSQKLMGFVRIAEAIFKTFGWPDVKNIDLRKTSRENRRENKLLEFGNLYFRYK